MLFLRRTQNQSITLFDPRTTCEIKVLRVDSDYNVIDIHIDGVGKRTLTQGQAVPFLQGEAVLKFSFIYTYDRYPAAASLGIEAPDSIAIYRTERLRGLGPDQIRALCR